METARITVNDLAREIDGTVDGDGSLYITGVASLDEASLGDLVLADTESNLLHANDSAASAVIVSFSAPKSSKTLIRTNNPRLAFAKALALFATETNPTPGIHNSAIIGERLLCGQDVSIGCGCFLGDDVCLGNRVVIHPQTYIGNGVTIGDNSIIYPGVCILQGTTIGSNCKIQSGTVIGADGFGYEYDGESYIKIPHIGVVAIGDNVDIGANVTIDRAKTGRTEIGSGTKIDNLVHIAHNVKIGRDCIIAAFTGIAGSVKIGDGVIFGGQAGVKDHVSIGKASKIAARAGVIGDIPGGTVVSGFPARDHHEEKRAQAYIRRLPEMARKIKELEDELNEIRNRQ